MIDNTPKVGSAPWFFWNEKVYVGKIGENHYNLFKRLLPADLVWEENVLTGRVQLYYDKVASVKFYSDPKIPSETKEEIEKGLMKYAAR